MTNFVKFEGYYFDLTGQDSQPLFRPWKYHFGNRFVGLLPYCFAFIIGVGFFYKKRNFSISFILLLFLCAIALLPSTFPFSLINDMARTNGIIDQIFRSSFTKFIIPYSLVGSYFFAFGTAQVEEIFFKVIKKRAQFIVVLVFILLVIYALPAFQGYFISPQMKVTIPQRYLELMTYLKQENKNQRIALLPEYTFWGWFFTKWGYNGSGFLWYGIEQPIVSRTFDVWSDKSESYYWEIQSAINAEDTTRFQDVLDKYNIDMLILDNSLLPVSSTFKGMQYDRIEKLLSQDPYITPMKTWGDLTLYHVKHSRVAENSISVATSLPVIGPTIKVTDKDIAYNLYGDYQSGTDIKPESYFPFLDFMSQTAYHTIDWTINEDERNFNITSPIKTIDADYSPLRLTISQSELFLNGSLRTYTFPILPVIQNNSLNLTIPKIAIDSFDISQTHIENCGSKNGENTMIHQGKSVVITSKNKATACFSYQAPELEERYGYLVKIKNKNLAGLRLFLYIKDETKQQTFFEVRLQKDTEYFILPERYQYGLGYNFVFQNASYENVKSTNELEEVSVFLLPIDQIKKIQLKSPSFFENSTSYLSDLNTNKIAYYLYSIKRAKEPIDNEVIILFQSFHPGWKAYAVTNTNWISQTLPFLFGTEINGHVVVNNWANGWKLDSSKLTAGSSSIVMVFWPQYLEYLGFVLLILTFGGILFWKNKKDK